MASNDFARGYFCAVAALINTHGRNTDTDELFRAGGDPALADPEDIETFRAHGLMEGRPNG
jgi:hypothetical protein